MVRNTDVSMWGFKPQISGEGGDDATNCAKITDLKFVTFFCVMQISL